MSKEKSESSLKANDRTLNILSAVRSPRVGFTMKLSPHNFGEDIELGDQRQKRRY